MEVEKRVQPFGNCLGESGIQTGIMGARQITGLTRGYVGTMERRVPTWCRRARGQLPVQEFSGATESKSLRV